MKKLFALLAMALALYACQTPQVTDETISDAIQKGNFTQAEQMIKLKIATEELTPGQVWDLDAKSRSLLSVSSSPSGYLLAAIFV